jgi:ornithine cyclodeaminase/alanine dehydrogenase-like protein (mu-crystallin family)
MIAAHQVRPFRRLNIWGRDRAKAEACARELAGRLGIAAAATDDPARAVADSQLVVTTTPARTPIFDASWLHPGLHVTAMGSDSAEKNEIDPRALALADRYITDRTSQCAILGELRSALASGHWSMTRDGAPTELGAIVSGQSPGRTDDAQITICDLTGTGAQDTAIATHALALAKAKGKGSTVGG